MAELTPEKLFELTGETVAHTPTRRRFADLEQAERRLDRVVRTARGGDKAAIAEEAWLQELVRPAVVGRLR